MKKTILILIMLFLTTGWQPARPQQSTKPLTKQQVMALVKAGMESSELAARIKQLGIDFNLTDDFLSALRKAGAQEVVINMLRTIHPRPLTRDQVLELLAGHVPSQRMQELVKERGIDFIPDQDYLETLRVAGGEQTLLAALRTMGQAPAAVGTIKTNLKDGLKYAWIPPGTFQMGCSPEDEHCQPDEKPAHPVTITRGFWFGQSPVTVAAYDRFASATGRAMPVAPSFNEGWNQEQMPLVNATWEDAHDFCQWAGGRLPTEAEWEYAARAGSTGASYGPLDQVAWYYSNSEGKTHESGQKRANGFALLDTLGNVAEWANDWYDAAYYLKSPLADPPGPPSGAWRVLRGGCWYNYAQYVRVSARYGKDADGGGLNGIRCVGAVSNP